MNPRRVVEQYPNSLEAQLLRAGRALQPPRSTQRKVLACIGLAAATMGSATQVGAAIIGRQGVSLAVGQLLKWGSIGVAATVLVGGAVRLSRTAHDASLTLPARAVVSPAVVAAPAPRLPPPQASRDDVASLKTIPSCSADAPASQHGAVNSAAAHTTRAEATAKSGVKDSRAVLRLSEATAASSSQSETLGAEVAQIDAVRRALDQQQAARAIQLLDEYARRFDKPRLAQEAAYLRVRALQQARRDAQANQSLEDFRRAYPMSPLLERR